MRIYVIAAKVEGEETPWIINAWDEWTMDANPSGFDEACEQAEERAGADAQIRIGIIEVPDSFLFDLFKPVVAKGTVVPTPVEEDDPMMGHKSEGGIGA